MIGTATSGNLVDIAGDEIDTVICHLGDDNKLRLEFLYYDGRTVTIMRRNLTEAGEQLALRDGAL